MKSKNIQNLKSFAILTKLFDLTLPVFECIDVRKDKPSEAKTENVFAKRNFPEIV